MIKHTLYLLDFIIKFAILALCSMTSANAIGAIKDYTSPDTQDLSIQYLQYLLGTTSGPKLFDLNLPAGSKTLFGVLMEQYTMLFIQLAFFIVIYQIVALTIDTARSGKFLGEKGSFWMPLRTAFGMALLFPYKTGSSYCIAQVLVLYIVNWGVGLGDYVYKSINSGFPGVKSSELSASDYVKAGYFDEIIKGAVCTAILRVYSSDFSSMFDVQLWFTSASGINQYTTLSFGNLFNPCYEVTIARDSVYVEGTSGDLKNSIVNEFNNQAKDYEVLARKFTDAITLYIRRDLNVANRNSKWSANKSILKKMLDVAIDEWVANIKNHSSEKTLEAKDYLQTGWLTAGIYFRDVLHRGVSKPAIARAHYQKTNVSQQLSQMKVNLFVDSLCSVTPIGGLLCPLIFKNFNYLEYYQTAIDKKIIQGLIGSPGANSGSSGGSFIALTNFKNDPSFNVDKARVSLFASWFDKATGGKNIFRGPTLEPQMFTDPFENVVNSAHGMMTAVASTFVGVNAALLIPHWYMNLGESTAPSGHVYNAVEGAGKGLLTVICGMFYALGSSLGIYMPLIPMLLYLVGSIGWFMFVITAIVTAPIVAVGILWPDKNEGFMGKSTPALMLYFNLLLRPALMVIGLFSGVIVCSIGLFLLMAAFTIADINGIISAEKSIFCTMVIGFAFVASAVAMVQKAFSLITLLPDRVLTWIGGSASAWSSFTQDAKSITSNAKDSLERGIRAKESLDKGSQDIAAATDDIRAVDDKGRQQGHLLALGKKSTTAAWASTTVDTAGAIGDGVEYVGHKAMQGMHKARKGVGWAARKLGYKG